MMIVTMFIIASLRVSIDWASRVAFLPNMSIDIPKSMVKKMIWSIFPDANDSMILSGTIPVMTSMSEGASWG